MGNNKERATKLRKRGKSYKIISKELGVPKSTLSKWFSQEKWSQKISNDLAKKANYLARERILKINKEHSYKWEQWREGFRKEAREEFPNLIKDPLFIAGISLYWGEGDSKMSNGIVRLSNVDPCLITIFVHFLQQILKVRLENLRVALVLYSDLSDNDCKNFWSRITGVPIKQFHKSQFIKGRHPTKRSEHGICGVVLSSRGAKEKIFTWIKLFCEKYQ